MVELEMSSPGTPFPVEIDFSVMGNGPESTVKYLLNV